MAHAHRGDGGGATAARAVAVSTARGERWSRSYAYWAWGFDAWLRGEWAESLRRTREALLLQRDFDDRVGAALMIELVAWTFASRGDVVEAGRLLGAVRAVWHTIGTSIAAFGPHLARHHARAERRVLEAVRAERFQQLLDQGGALDPAEALDRALGTDLAAARSGAGPVAARSGADTAAIAGGHVLGHGPGAGSEYERLTPRERQVAALLASGLSNRRIATELTLSVRTIEHHVEHVLAKLAFSSRTQVASWAARQPEGWADPGRIG
jgi:DNA-binding CsgD family transcriptional regulator